MESKFVNRKKELFFLNKLYSSNSSEFLILYGRRRIGKTKLVYEFLKNKSGVYYLCTQEDDLINIRSFKQKLSLYAQKEFNNLNFESWYDLFSIFIKLKNTNKKFVFIIDEFPYLIKKNKSIPSIFQKIWDEILYNENIFLIILGSSMSIMEKQVLNIKSPLYGRRTSQLELKSIPFIHLDKFFPKYSFEELLKIYFVFGGIPAYLQKLDFNKSFEDNLINKVFTKGEFLNLEGDLILSYEFNESNNYKLILKAISKGKNKQSEIVDFTYLDYSLVSKYLFVLKNLNIIFEEIPVTKTKKFKKRIYKIKDNFLQFWFKFIYSDLSLIEFNSPKNIYKYYKKEINSYFGFKFEDLIKELFVEGIIKTKNKYFNFGRVWDKIPKKYSLDKNQSYEIDLVGVNNENNKKLFCEVKFKENINPYVVFKELYNKSNYIESKDDLKEFFIISKSFYKKPKKIKGIEINCIDLNDLKKMCYK